MELDPSHQQLKHQLMAVFDRASRSADQVHQKTRDMSIVLEEEAKKNGGSRLTMRINGARKPKAKDEESDAENEGDAVPETTQ